jgi:hypothetical protein
MYRRYKLDRMGQSIIHVAETKIYRFSVHDLLAADAEALNFERCQLESPQLGAPLEGTLEADGVICFELEARVTSGTVKLFFREEDYVALDVELGDFVDAESLPGAQMRLNNLGYRSGEQEENEGDADCQAAKRLQESFKDGQLEVTENLDDATKSKLEELCGL